LHWRCRSDEIEPLVIDAVRAIHSDPERYARSVEIQVDALKQPFAQIPADAAAVGKLVVILRGEESVLTDGWQRGVIDEADYLTHPTQVSDKLRGAKADLDSVRSDAELAVGRTWAAHGPQTVPAIGEDTAGGPRIHRRAHG
jgi:hypothetical protein